MNTYNPSALPLTGHLNIGTVLGPPDPTRFGLKTLVFGGNGLLHAQCGDEYGDVARFLPLTAPDAGEFTPMACDSTQALQALGRPCLYGLVADPTKPTKVTVLPWLEMAKLVFDSYDQLRPHLVNNPIAGFQLTGFMTGGVPRFVAANHLEGSLDLGAREFELADMDCIAARIWRNSPEFRDRARAAGYQIKFDR